jgi:exodeoxyribonuclease V alpha subunit
VANRDIWIVTKVRDDGTVHLVGTAGTRELPLRYAVHYVELAYAWTIYGAQGDTSAPPTWLSANTPMRHRPTWP